MWFDKKNGSTYITALAPMADLTDSPFCRICRKVSGKDFVIFREMVSAEALVRDNAKTFKMCKFDKTERPIVLQIFGGDPAVMAKAARLVVKKFKPDGLDINMGCPMPKIVNRSNSGSMLLKDQARAIKIVKAIKKANLGVPISVKTRLGWGENDEILKFAPKLEKAGADALIIHGRTKVQGYSGRADWAMIGKVKSLTFQKRIKPCKKDLSNSRSSLSRVARLKVRDEYMPIIANGDITSLEDIKRCLEITGADGVMIGRAALGNPWIFSEYVPKVKEIKKVVLEHAKMHLDHYGAEYGLATFRKHLLAYFKGLPNIAKHRLELAQVKDIEQLKKILKKIPE